MRDRKKRITVVIMICILLVVVSGCSKEKNSDTLEEVQQREKTESVEVSDETENKADETENKADETEQTVDTEPVKKAGSEGVIYVFVCGQVASPGVYELPEGSRICQAIDAAGGMLDTASNAWVKQAKTAEDGQKIYVPSTEEAETMPEGQTQETSSAEGTDGKVHLNAASREELMTLTGIGEKKADAIIRYRESNGGFQSVDELMQVEGIKEGTYNKIKDSIVI